MSVRESAALQSIDSLFRVGTSSGLSDAELLDRYVSGERERAEASFEALVLRHGPMVFDVCRKVLDNTHDAQDAFQATWLVLAARARSIRRKTSVASWLYGVALRVAAHARAESARRRAREH